MGDVGGLTCKIMRCTFNEEPDHSQQAMDRHGHDVHLCVVHVHGSHGVAGGREQRGKTDPTGGKFRKCVH